MDYKPDYEGLSEILTSEDVRAHLFEAATAGAEIAKTLATPFTRTGAFRESIHAENAGTVDFVNSYGVVSRRACVQIVADSDDAETVEFGAKNRYARGLNREGHHILGLTAKMLGG